MLFRSPQLLALVWMLTSQPLFATPSQLAKPAAQAPRMQAPVAHDSAAFARSHTTPQAPQFDRVVVLVSHPLLASPSQLP